MTLMLQALSSELLKLRRTAFLPVAIIFPSLVAVVQALLMLTLPSRFGAFGYGRFSFYMRQNAVSTWALLLLGMFITVEAVLLAGVDHDGKHWKYLFARATPRWTIYLAKILLGIAAVALASVVLGVVLYVIGHALYTPPPPNANGNGIPEIIWTEIAYSIGRVFLASWGLVALLTWLCVRVASPVIPATIGLIGTAAGILLPLGPTYEWVRFDPWLMPYFAQNRETTPLLLGLGAGLLLTILGCVDVTRRDVV